MVRKMAMTGGRRGGLLLALAVAVAGVGLIVFAVASQQPAPPAPPSSAAGTVDPAPSASSSSPEEPKASNKQDPAQDTVEAAQETPLGPSEPESISIPAIDVRSEVFSIGKAADGSLAVPQPGPNLDKAAWFENSPTPGQPGPSVIEGHVATEESGPSIFFNLGNLRPGDEITVKREDGKTAVFTVDAVRNFDKNRFPTELVYGGNLSTPTLRLITCSNFDSSVGQHTGNLVVFSQLTDVRDS